jgi:hypothetical protein
MNKQYSPSLQPLMQSLLATLADIDFAHDCELERIESGSGDRSIKARVRSALNERHRQQRDPYVQQLGLLQARIQSALPEDRHGRRTA